MQTAAFSGSQRSQNIQSFKVMELLKRAKALERAGHDVIHLEVGEPDFPTPEPIAQAGIEAISTHKTQYTPAAGIPELREAIAKFYATRYEVSVDPEEVMVTAGASAALLLAFARTVDTGQSIMMSDPGYPCNRQMLRFLEAKTQIIPTTGETQFQLTAAMIAQHWQAHTAGVLLASPANPSGTLIADQELQKIVAQVKQQQGQLIVDEIYQGLTYGFEGVTVRQYDPQAFIVNSFSKYFGMTGWRLGWMLAPKEHVKVLEKMAQNLFISPNTVSQYAALAAFEPETIAILEARRAAYALRRDCLVQGLLDLGFSIPAQPQGAFYVYADASRWTNDSFAFCWSLLEEEHIAITPGVDFGEHQAHRYVRLAYTTGIERIEQALRRLRERFNRLT